MQFNSIAEFLVYVIPGFIALEIYRSAYPVRARSDFINLTWSIVFGIVISYTLIWFNATVFGNILQYKEGALPSFQFLIALLLLGIVIGLLRVFMHFVRFRLASVSKIFHRLNPDPQSVWAQVNRPDNSNWAVVFLDDNSIYLGFIETYRYDPDSVDQDFLLAKAKRVDENLNVQYEIDGLGVYLNTRNVKRIEYCQGELPEQETR